MTFKPFHAAAALWVSTLAPLSAQLEPLPEDAGVAAVGLALRQLGTCASLLYVTAHPDDENNALLMALGRGRGVRTGLLTLTRGDGGQNEIGPELFEALGVLRCGEQMAVHRHDKAEQFFSLAYEFGYSFSVEETVRRWGKRETLADIVRVIRTFRPDVLVTMAPSGEGGGQHHQASARLAMLAFDMAADRDAFPGQLAEGLRPWRAGRLYHSLFVRSSEEVPPQALRVPVGDFEPLLGMSYAEYGALARNHHRCQGMNAPPVPGEQFAYLLAPNPDGIESGAGGDLFDGVEITLAGRADRVGRLPAELRAALDRLQASAVAARAAFEGGREDVAALVMSGLGRVRELRQRLADQDVRAVVAEGDRRDLDFLLDHEERDWLHAAAKAHHLFLEARLVPDADAPHASRPVDGKVVPGESFAVLSTLVHRGRESFRVLRLDVLTPPGWEVAASGESRYPAGGELRYNERRENLFRVTVGEDAALTQPYWYRDDPDRDRYATRVSAAQSILPFLPPPVWLEVTYESHGVEASCRVPARHVWYDPAAAKRRSFAVKVVPGISLGLEPAVVIHPLASRGEARRLRVSLLNNLPDAVETEVRLEVPAGWRVNPSARTLRLARENDEATLSFDVLPASDVVAGEYVVQAHAVARGETYRRGYRTIAYHHVETRHLYADAASRVVAMDVRVANDLRAGYIMGVGDEVSAAMESLGVDVHLLEREDLATADLSVHDVIVAGVRAYKERTDLIAHNHRLLEYVHDGGVLLVQYNKYEFNDAQYGPYPMRISRPHDRVTDENSRVSILEPESPVFNLPNAIGPADWQGWIQERGLYFLGSWDPRCTPLLEMEDPFEYNRGPKRGSLVLVRHGKGVYVYTGIGFFRQLPAAVPGAYRLFANLLSLSRTLVREE